MDIIEQYKYLGIVITEHLDFMLMSKTVAQFASRALGLLILKDKSFGGMPFEWFTQCYNATVQAIIIDYSAAIWGTKSISSINAVQNRACRYFPGLADMHQMPLLLVTWVGLHQNTGNGCVSQEI